jgi:sigma-B regulation protein RsbU (phosphoserine phosphatase)
MRFYAGVPIRSPEGYNVGVISVVDFTPRTLTEEQLASLLDLAALVTDELELQVASRQLRTELPVSTGDVPTPALRYPHAV